MMWFFSLLIILAALCAGVVIAGMRRRRLKVPMAMRGVIQKQWHHVRSIDDPEKRLIEAEKVLHHALRSAGQEGTLGEILKRIGSRVRNVDAVWSAHKLRNRLAHEPGFHPSASALDHAVLIFEKTLGTFLK